jgi:hypothetical protein
MAGGRMQARTRLLRRFGLGALIAGVLALLFLLGGHWIIGIVLAAVAAAFVWLYMQTRSLR